MTGGLFVIRYVAVPLKLARRSSRRPDTLGLVDEIRQAVLGVKRTHPNLADSRLLDVSLKRRGDEVLVTLYFTP